MKRLKIITPTFHGFLALSALIVAGCDSIFERRSDSPDEQSAASTKISTIIDIQWDEWGVAHIEAQSIDGAFYGLGWAQARARPNMILRSMGRARGRAAEYWGEEYYDSDIQMWQLGLPQQLDQMYALQGEEYGARIDAFAKGINDYATRHPEAIEEGMDRVLPVTAQDVLGHIMRTINLDYIAESQIRVLEEMAAGASSGEGKNSAGSNAWAVGPSRSQSGNAMLLSNPHMPWEEGYYWFESHVEAPDFNYYGVSLSGMPFHLFAFNEATGWSHTVNTYDGADIYEFDLTDEGFVGPNGLTPFDEETVSLKVRNNDGLVEDRPLRIRRTSAGPVMFETEGKAYTLKIAGLEPENSRATEQYWRMAKAQDLAEFQDAMSMLQMPFLNTVYADRSGDIFYLFNGLLPDRKTGDSELWSGRLNGANPDHYWSQYLPYERLPKFSNPVSGFVQNANEPPWTSTMPPALNPADYPGDLVPPELWARAQHSITLLSRDDRIRYDDFVAYSQSTELAAPANVLDDLIEIARNSGDKNRREAADVLDTWDRQVRVESRGAVLFEFWLYYYGEEKFYTSEAYEKPWLFHAPGDFPSGLADPEAAMIALDTAVAEVRDEFGMLNVSWGEYSRVRRFGLDQPLSGATGSVGAFRVNWVETTDEDGVYEIVGGTSYVAAIEFGETPQANGLLVYGNFTNPPDWVRSQWDIYASGSLRPINFQNSKTTNSIRMREALEPGLE